MSDPMELNRDRRRGDFPADGRPPGKALPEGIPSNPVYARVGDVILEAARDGVRRNLPATDIVREILAEHRVHLTVGELRLLLASRRLPHPQSPASG